MFEGPKKEASAVWMPWQLHCSIMPARRQGVAGVVVCASAEIGRARTAA